MSADHDWVPAWFNFSSFFSASAGIGVHTLHGGVDIAPTLRSEFLGIAAKLVGCFAPRFQLGIGLKLERRLLVLDLLAEALDVFLDLGLEQRSTQPLVLPLRWSRRPR